MTANSTTLKVRILRADPNSITKSSQFVTTATVSTEIALLFEDYRKGRKTLQEATQEVDRLSAESITKVPFSVYLNVHSSHASVLFLQTDLLNRSNAGVEESRKLARMESGILVFFSENSFQIINPTRVRRIDLFTEDGQQYKIEMNGDILKSGIYKMFKCYEVIGISDFDVEWAYLMAAQDWYDTAANNCLSFSKRIIREIHRHVMGGDLEDNELKKLNKLYISVPGEAVFEKFRSRISSFLTPSWQPCIVVTVVIIFFLLYIEIRLRY